MKKSLILFVLLLSTASFGVVRNVVTNCSAVGDGVHNDTTAINNCIALLGNGDTLLFPAGTYLVTTLNPINVSNVIIDGSNSTATIISTTTQQGPMFTVGTRGINNSFVSCTGWPGIAAGSSLSTTANEGTTSFTTTNSLTGVVTGSHVLLIQGGKDSSNGSGDTGCDPSGCRAEIVKVTSVVSKTYNIDTMLHDTWNPSVNNAMACPINGVVNNITLQNIIIDGGTTTAQTSGNSWAAEFNTCDSCTVNNVTFRNALGSAFLHTLNYNNTYTNITISGAGSEGCGAAWQGYANSNEKVNTVSLSNLNPGTSTGVCLGDGAFGYEDVNFDNSTATNVTVNSNNAGGRPMKLTASRWATYNNLIVENGHNAAGFNGLSLEYYTSHVLFNGGSIINNAGGSGSGSGGVNTFGNFNQFDTFYNLTITGNGNVQVINSKFDALGLAQDGNQSWFNNTIGGSGTIGMLYYGSNGCINNNTLNSGLGSGISINSPSTGTVGTGNTLNGNSSNLVSGSCGTSGSVGAGGYGVLSGSSISFGNQAVGTTSSPSSITLTNGIGSNGGTGSITFVKAPYFITGTQFAISSNTCTTTVVSAGTCTTSITFTPTSLGAQSDTLVYLDNASGAYQLVTLTGTGTGSSGSIVASPLSLTFGGFTVGVTSPAQTVTLTNNFSSGTSLISVTMSGDFAQSNSCGTIAPSGGTCPISVTFTPSAVGSRTGSMVIVPSQGGTITIPLSGTGLAAPTIPTVTTTTATSISTAGAIAGGVVTSNGGASVTSEGTCYATTANPTSPCTSNGTATPFTSIITGLTSSTTYHYRAFATNSIGTGYGSDKTFTTLSAAVPPTVTTTIASSITSHSAVSGGIVTSNGGASITSEGVCYATTVNPTSPCTSDGTATPFTSNLTSLTNHVTYNYRAFATNSAGTSYGTNLTFFTTGGGGNTQGSGHGTGNFNIYLYTYQGFGPPLYNGSSHSTAVATLPSVPNLGTTTGLNTVTHEYASNTDFYYPSSGVGNAISRLTDINSGCGSSNTDGYFATWSGGGNDLMWGQQSGGGYYGAVVGYGGGVCYLHVHIQPITGALINDTQPLVFIPGVSTSGGFSASRVAATPNVFYHTNYAVGTKTGVYKDTLTGTNPISVSSVKIFDWNNCPGVPGNLTALAGYGQLGVNYNDTIFTEDVSFDSGGQGSALWELAFDTATGACASYYTGQVLTTENPANGNIWAYCTGNCSQQGTNPAPLALNTVCAQPGFGMHGNQQTHSGLYVIVSGLCNGVVNSLTVWQIGVNSIFTCNNGSNNCGGHDTSGYSTFYNDASTINVRPAASPTSITSFAASGIGPDFHGSEQWVGVLADINPWMVSTTMDVVGTCATQPYCYELLAIRQDGTIVRFANTFFNFFTGSLGPVSTMTQDGLYMIYGTNNNSSFGIAIDGNPRSDVLAIGPLQ